MKGSENPGFEMDEKSSQGATRNGIGTEQATQQDQPTMSKIRIFKNLFIVCLGFMLLFGAFQALGNLQSTLNAADGLGTTSQSVIYAFLIISSFFLPTFVIRNLGCKLALGICMLMYTPYIAAQFYVRFGTMIPAAIILGLGAAPMWSAKCTYLNEIGFRYSKHVNINVDTIIVRFFGIFFMFFQSSQIWGNLISYLVLTPESEDETSADNITCGINYDHSLARNNTNLQRPEPNQVNTLIGVYLAMGVLGGLLVLVFLDPLERQFGKAEDGKPIWHLFVATFKHLKKPQQLVLIPLTIYSGLEQAFFLSEFTKSYVGCAWGIPKIGLVAISFGVVNAIVSLTSGPTVRLVRRIPIFVTAALVNVGVCVGLIVWTPNTDQTVIFFVIAGLWGLGDAVWQTQINAFYGVLFQGEEEPAFSNYRMWESLGFVMAFAYERVGVPVKMGILLTFLGLGMAGYLYTEIVFVRRIKSEQK